MNALDYSVVGFYLIGLLFFGFLLRKQSGEGDYFLGGRSIGWFPLTLSTMATQLSAISFISAPAFVGFREGGGLKWLTYEFSVPLAMILVMFVISPALYRSGFVSIYQFLEARLGRSTRMLVSISFQVIRAFGTGIMVYAIGLILDAALGIPFWQSVVIIGVITLIYSASGGMKAVVYGDALQMALIFGGLVLVAAFALAEIGGFQAFWHQVDADRLTAVDFSSLGFSGDEFGFLPMVFGGFVLYASYYGCDQTQAQRILSSQNMGGARRILLANGLLRFPLVVLYCFAGLMIGVAVANSPELLAKIPADKPDYMMPVFILERLPNGLIGILFVAITAAAMSSLSSTVNSLAAVTLEDLSVLGLKPGSDAGKLNWARGLSIFWGVVILILSAFAGSIAPTVIEAINKIGSTLYGPILAIFLIAILFRNVSAASVNIGLLLGVALNLYLWLFEPQVFWMWWNLIGFVVTISVAVVVSTVAGLAVDESAPLEREQTAVISKVAGLAVEARRMILILGGFFLVMIAFSVAIGMVGANPGP